MANDVLAEALARIEHKMDMIVKHLNIPSMLPMGYPGHICPVCKTNIDYQIDIMKQVVVRKCLCSTGKVVFTININQIPGAELGKATSNEAVSAGDYPTNLPSDDGRRR